MEELLVVVDMQNDFITGVLGTNEAKAVVPKVCNRIANWSGDIIMTRDTHHDYYMNTAEGRMLPVPHCIEGSAGWQVNDEVRAAYDSKYSVGSGHFFALVDKETFGCQKLMEIAKFLKYDRVVLCGVCTDVCVISNAFLVRTALPEAEVIVDASCCAGICPESHRLALDAMAPCNIKIMYD